MGEGELKFGGAAFDFFIGGYCAVFGGGFAGIEVAQAFDFEAVGVDFFGNAHGFGGGFVGFAVFAFTLVFIHFCLGGFDGHHVFGVYQHLLFFAGFGLDVVGAHGVIGVA